MPVTRMRMRPWLEKQIESSSILGLTWVDKEKKMFSIPWKHAARHGWELDKDASLFREWAIHTGKYVEGQTCDPKTWKANFRCAMNSLPDIEEVKDRSVNKGHQAVRVFRMLPATPKNRDKRIRAKETKTRKKSTTVKIEEDSEDNSDSPSPMNVSMDSPFTQENTVDSTVNTEQSDFTYVSPSEVPDPCASIEIGPSGFTNCFPLRFEVSPEHSPDHDYDDDIVQICQQLERESTLWMPSSLDIKGFLNNEESTSPESLWSESSSGEDVDDMPLYTPLNSMTCSALDMDWLGHKVLSML